MAADVRLDTYGLQDAMKKMQKLKMIEMTKDLKVMKMKQ